MSHVVCVVSTQESPYSQLRNGGKSYPMISQDPIPSATANLSDGLAGAWPLQVLSCRVCIKWSPIEVEILKKRHVSVFYAPFLEDFRGADRNRGLLF